MGEAPDSYLSTRQAAALLGLSHRTLERYRVTGGGPPFLRYCNRVHYLRADLDAWALASRRRSTSDDGGAAGTRDERPERIDGIIGARRGRRASCRPADSERRPPEDAEPTRGTAATASGRLSVRELAALLQVSRRTLDRYRARGIGPAFEKVDGRVLYARVDVEAWLATSRRVPNPAAGEDEHDAGDDAPGGA